MVHIQICGLINKAVSGSFQGDCGEGKAAHLSAISESCEYPRLTGLGGDSTDITP